MIKVLLISMINFFAYNTEGNINYFEANEPIGDLVAMPCEVWRFTVPKATLQGKCIDDITIEWFKQVDKVDCDTEIENRWLGSAGTIETMLTEKYGEFAFDVNGDLAGTHLSIVAEKTGTLFSYLANEGTINELLDQINKHKGVVKAESTGNEVSVKVSKRYCGEVLTVSDGIYNEVIDAPNGLLDVELINEAITCNCVDEYQVEIKMPLDAGCYHLALRENSALLPLAMTIPILVHESNTERSVFVKAADVAIRILGELKPLGVEYETSERALSGGGFSRKGLKLYDGYNLITPYTTNEYQRQLVPMMHYDNLKINNRSFFSKEYSTTHFQNDKFNGTFKLVALDNLINTNNACYANLAGNVRVLNNTNHLLEFRVFKKGKLKGIFNEDIQLPNGSYTLEFDNSHITPIVYKIISGGLKTDIDGTINAKSKGKISFEVCNCNALVIVLENLECKRPDAPILSVVNNCNGTSTLHAIGDNIKWSNGQTGNTIIVNVTGEYSATQTFNFNESDSSSITANPKTNPAIPIVSKNNTTQTVTITAVTGVMFIVDGASPTAALVYAGLSVGNHTFKAVKNGCESAEVIVNIEQRYSFSYQLDGSSNGNNGGVAFTNFQFGFDDPTGIIDWGDGTTSPLLITNNHNYSNNNSRTVTISNATTPNGYLVFAGGSTNTTSIDVSQYPGLQRLSINAQKLTSFPNIANNINLRILAFANMINMVGNIPDLSHLSLLEKFLINDCDLDGSFLGFPSSPLITHIDISRNRFSGVLPSFSNNTKLVQLVVNYNKFTSFTGSFGLNVSGSIDYSFYHNLFNQASIDKLLQEIDLIPFIGSGDFFTLSGDYFPIGTPTNAAPSAAGIVSKNSIISKGAYCVTM